MYGGEVVMLINLLNVISLSHSKKNTENNVLSQDSVVSFGKCILMSKWKRKVRIPFLPSQLVSISSHTIDNVIALPSSLSVEFSSLSMESEGKHQNIYTKSIINVKDLPSIFRRVCD